MRSKRTSRGDLPLWRWLEGLQLNSSMQQVETFARAKQPTRSNVCLMLKENCLLFHPSHKGGNAVAMGAALERRRWREGGEGGACKRKRLDAYVAGLQAFFGTCLCAVLSLRAEA
jgi:hypothetical protein